MIEKKAMRRKNFPKVEREVDLLKVRRPYVDSGSLCKIKNNRNKMNNKIKFYDTHVRRPWGDNLEKSLVYLDFRLYRTNLAIYQQ